MKSNPQQQRIFDAPTDFNIAVSAGAGTGKSTTLKNKVIDLIQRRVYKPSEFLIVTFTNDAANSLKNKIKLGIRDKEGCEDLVSEVDSMHIDTLDAFRLFIVKKYALTIGLTGNVGVLDPDIMLLEEYKILDRLLEPYYANNDPTLIKIVENYLVKNDGAMVKLIVSVANTLDVTNKTKDEVVNNYISTYLNDTIINNRIDEFMRYHYEKLRKMVNSMYTLLESIPENSDGTKTKDYLLLSDRYDALFTATTVDELIKGFELLNTVRSDEKLNGKLDKTKYDEYDAVKKLNNKIKKFKIITCDDYKNIDLVFNHQYIPFLVGIAYDLKVEIDKFMKDHGVYRFSDLSKLALKVLENEEALNEIKSSFKMIMIDEYQDNSDEDDAFFTKISNNNLFLVGDVKQSIYGFKGANPEKFTEKYVKYSDENKVKNPKDPKPYTMNINYRSRKEILDGVNDIFENFMDLNYGGVDYKDNHALVYDKNFLYDNAPTQSEKDKGITKMMVGDKDNLLGILNALVGEGNEFEEKAIKGKEFLVTAALSILDRINNHAKVAKKVGVDENGNDIYDLVDATFKDFSVLTRDNVDSEACRNIFNALGIPVNIVADEKITQDTMVVTLMSFLRLINLLNNDLGEQVKVNNEYIYVHEHEVEIKHYFTSILRSFVFHLNDQEIYELIADKKSGEITNFKYRNTDIYKAIEQFSYDHKSTSLHETVIDIVNGFGFVEKLSSLGNAISSIQKLTKLLEKIAAMDEIGYTLSDLAYYFENMDDLNLSFDVRLGNDSNNAVTVETFHKSKGLEFPIIYIDCTKALRSGRNRTNCLGGGRPTSFYGNPKLGYFLPSKTYTGNNPSTFIISEYARMIEDKTTVSEETRLFYVALTRAKEVAICVYPVRKEPLDHNNKEDVNSYADIIEYSGFKIKDDAYGFGTSKLEPISNAYTPTKVECLENKITYEPISKTSHHPSIQEESGVSDYILKKGIRYHAYMQYVDFISKDTSFIKSKYDRANIDKVLSLDIFKDLDNVRIYKEYNYYDEDIDENGIIDLLLVYEDRCLVVDYKLKNADETKYASQLEAYKNYVEKVFKKPTDTVLISLLGN